MFVFTYQVYNYKRNTNLNTLKSIEDELSKYDFLQINNNILINPCYTKTVDG